MAGTTSSPAAREVEAAIMRVLDAERRGRATVEEARRQAAVRVEQARGTAVEIAKRAEQRIRAIQVAFEQRVATQQQAVEAEIRALAEPEAEDAVTRRVALDTVERLAAHLTGGADD